MTWAQALRDMVVASINRGQLPVFGIFFVLLMLVWKMPGEDVSKLVFEIFALLRNGELFAYILAFLLGIGWFVHARIMRKVFSDEFERIGLEKSELQGKLAGKKFGSSNHS
jgi:hypothetical protein